MAAILDFLARRGLESDDVLVELDRQHFNRTRYTPTENAAAEEVTAA